MSSLIFLGAAGTVTGSKHLLEAAGHRILVDCGLFQGLKELRLRNWEPLPVDPSSIDAVVLTHAHLDHCGYLPRLVSNGFRGRIFCTPATKELCGLVLPDSAHLQEEDARAANRGGYSKHHPALPLYTSIDAVRALDHLQPVGYERPVPLLDHVGRTSDVRQTYVGQASDVRPIDVGPSVDADAMSVEFVNAGHLLGSAFARIRVNDRIILFGGDLGRYNRPVLPDPSPVSEADHLVLESTYGDRLHEQDDDGAKFAEIIRLTADRGGKLIIPSFAIGRVEELLYWLKRLEDERRIPVLPVYVDSPMAAAALQFYASRFDELDSLTHSLTDSPAHSPTDSLTPSQTNKLPPGARHVAMFSTTRLTVVTSPQQSADLVASRRPAIVISSSGMATGGRVLHHLAAALPDPRNTVLFVGYQAAGTRGRALCDGAKAVKLHGRDVPVAARIERIDWMSAHADADEIMRWLSGFTRAPRRTFLVHGEPSALDALSARITRERGWPVHIAVQRERVDLD